MESIDGIIQRNLNGKKKELVKTVIFKNKARMTV